MTPTIPIESRAGWLMYSKVETEINVYVYVYVYVHVYVHVWGEFSVSVHVVILKDGVECIFSRPYLVRSRYYLQETFSVYNTHKCNI